MALYHKWDVKNDFPYVLQFFSLISDGLGSVQRYEKDFMTDVEVICKYLKFYNVS